ncbi:MAG: hypothetical protein J5518_01260 [Lachnospiraceae bacterium]|nr:hypothetical protein [Lachnospiraceae bacterium]
MHKKERFIAYPILFIVSVLFLLAFSLWESPLYRYWYGCDASFFSMAGRGITQGWVPYLDFFDLKGPYFFFLQALGQFIHTDRLGIWILEIPFLFASLILMYEIARLFVNRLRTVAILLIILFMHVATLWGGNTLEEYMLPLSLLTLFLTLRAAMKGRSENAPAVSSADGTSDASAGTAPGKFMLQLDALPFYVPLITGICFGIIAFSKITVAAPIAGVVIAVALNNLLNRNWRALFSYLAFALLGVVIAVTPIFLYFGCHHAIPRMLYCVFTFATKRSVDFSEPFGLDWELKTIGAVFSFVFALVHPRKLGRPMQILILSMSAVTYILLHLGVPFIYYFTTVFPVLVLSLAVFLKMYDPFVLFTNIRQFLLFTMIVVMLYFYSHSSMDTINTFLHGRDNEWYEADYQAAKDLATLIPARERDQVFSFSVDMIWFEVNQILPCNPYQVNLQFFIDLDPRIEEDLTAYLYDTPPKWLVIGDSFEGEIPSLFAIVDEKYECICTNNAGNLYLLKED